MSRGIHYLVVIKATLSSLGMIKHIQYYAVVVTEARICPVSCLTCLTSSPFAGSGIRSECERFATVTEAYAVSCIGKYSLERKRTCRSLTFYLLRWGR